jgi:hypothetical protein
MPSTGKPYTSEVVNKNAIFKFISSILNKKNVFGNINPNLQTRFQLEGASSCLAQ